MISLDGQDGRQRQSQPPNDIPRQFAWDAYNKNTQCKFRHELDSGIFKCLVKCHDYQNPSGCTRELFMYVHATKEDIFYREKQIPNMLRKSMY